MELLKYRILQAPALNLVQHSASVTSMNFDLTAYAVLGNIPVEFPVAVEMFVQCMNITTRKGRICSCCPVLQKERGSRIAKK